MNLRDTWLHRAAKALIPNWLHPTAVLTRTVVRRAGTTVAAGPFQGMRYVATGVGSAYHPKLLGVYERELHPVVDAIAEIGPDRIIDIGAAEGYYAVGLAIHNPRTEIVAFEQETEGQTLLRDMATRNGVADRVRVMGRCEPADLRGELVPATKPVVFCDVEGYETALLDPVAIPELINAWILAELHEFIVPGVGKLIRSRFDKTHFVTEIAQIPRTRSDCPYLPWYARLLPAVYATYPVNEFRPERMSWLWLQPRKAAGG
jgi:hypothetical protein